MPEISDEILCVFILPPSKKGQEAVGIFVLFQYITNEVLGFQSAKVQGL